MKHSLGSAEILNIARSAGPRWILTFKTLPKLSFWANLVNFSISQISSIFHENLKFHHHGPKFEVGITSPEIRWKLSRSESESSWSQLRLDKRQLKRLTDFRAQTKKNSPKIWIVTSHVWSKFATDVTKILLYTALLRKAVSTSHIKLI